MNRQLRRREARQKRGAGAQRGGDPSVDLVINGIDAKLKAGRVHEALEMAREAAAAKPELCETQYAFGIVLQALGRFDEAVDAYRRAVELEPSHLQALVNLAVCLRELGHAERALETLDRAARLQPDSVHVRYNRALALCDLRQVDAAIGELEHVLRIMPTFADAHFQLGFLLEMLQHYDAAIDHYEKALSLNPTSSTCTTSLGACLQIVGRFEEAAAHLRKAISIRPQAARAHYLLAYSDQADRSPEALSALDRLLDTSVFDDDERMTMCFAAGRLNEKAGNFDRAFELYAQGNRLRNATLAMDLDAYKALPQDIERVFDHAFFDRLRDAGDPTDRLVFVVGMPRSGTTLVEQILASHPDAVGVGELGNLARIGAVRGICEAGPDRYPDNVADLTGEDVAALARRYLEDCPEAPLEARRVVEKTPGNALALGLLAVMFPNARFVACNRDPMDTCWSIYSHNFATALPYASAFDRLVAYFHAHQGVMAHWRKALGDRILDLDYEELVAAPEPQVRRLVAHCGLEWDERCLNFHQTERSVQTASLWQVRKPIFSTSIGKWRKFERHLEPLKQALQTPAHGNVGR